MNDLEARIKRETDAAIRIVNLRTAHERLAKMKVELKSLQLLVDPILAGHFQEVRVNEIERWMWSIEEDIRADQKGEGR